MASLLDQTIEQISREKHIEPEIIVAAIEDAMVVAARKYYKTEEDLRAKFNPESGQVDVFAVRAGGRGSHRPQERIDAGRSRKIDPNAEVGGEILIPKPTDVLGRIAAQTAKQVIMQKVREAERDTILQRIQRPRRRTGELHRQAHRRSGRHRGYGPHRSAPAQARTIASRDLQHRRSSARGDPRRRPRRQGPAGDRLARRSRAGAAPVSKWKCRKFTTAPCRFAPPRAKPASAPRSPCRAATRTSIPWAPASA